MSPIFLTTLYSAPKQGAMAWNACCSMDCRPLSVLSSNQYDFPLTPAIRSGAPLRNPALHSRVISARPFFSRWFGTEKTGMPAFDKADTISTCKRYSSCLKQFHPCLKPVYIVLRHARSPRTWTSNPTNQEAHAYIPLVVAAHTTIKDPGAGNLERNRIFYLLHRRFALNNHSVVKGGTEFIVGILRGRKSNDS